MEGRALGRDALVERFGRWGRRLHELAWGIDNHPVQAERAHTQISSEDTLEADLPIDALAPHIERMAAKTWAAWQRQCERDAREQRPPRRARTVVLKLKTSDFRILTRSLTPARLPGDVDALAGVARALCGRVALPASTRYRLVGVGLANLGEAGPQVELFDDT
jgi:DNA polymerase-4